MSSAAYAAVPVFAVSTAYTVGQFMRPSAPASAREYSFRCTTAGTTAASEPSFAAAIANNSTVTSGGATFTNVSGQSAYGWSAPAGTVACIVSAVANRAAVGDRIYLSSDHTETTATATYAFGAGAAFGLIQLISVSRAGSVPPVAADVTSGAAIASTSGTMTLDPLTDLYWQGITISGNSGTGAGTISFGSSGTKNHYFKNCAFRLLTTLGTARINFASPTAVTFDNCTAQFANASQAIASGANGSVNLTWLNTPSAIQGATLPTTLFLSSTATTVIANCRGVDLSAVTGNLANDPSATSAVRLLLDSCRIASGVARLGSTYNNASNEVELVNCYDGTNVLNERHTPAGAVTTDRTTYLSGGAQDDIGAYALKLVSSSRSDKATLTLDSFALDVGLATVGASMTAMVEIVGSGSLNNDDISLLLEYMGTSGSPIASFASSLPATVLTTASALASSSATWNSPPGTPVYQKLSVIFTPQRAGRLRGLVKLGKPSTTVWIDPVVRIT